MQDSNYISFGYWDSLKRGLLSGDKLQYDLRRLETAYLEQNRREFELTKSISLLLLDPLALMKLRETGRCFISLPEEIFDLDYPGHHFRRIKSVSITLPCVVGPYTTISCTLRLLKNSIRINTADGDNGYPRNTDDQGVPADDDRFVENNIPVKSIATSTGQSDAGLFEINSRDERYLPFEGAGVISEWKIELTRDAVLCQFDHSTITDIIMHISYTAREDAGQFKAKCVEYFKSYLQNSAGLSTQPLLRMFSMRHEFPTEWHKFLNPATAGGEQVLRFTTGKERFPFIAHDRVISVMKVEAFAKCTQAEDYHTILSYTDFDEDTVTSSEITMLQNDSYLGLNKATINVINDAGLSLEELDITGEMSLKLKRSAALDYTSLVTEPSEVEDIFLAVHYKLN